MRSLFVLAIAAPFIASAQQVHKVIVGSSTGQTTFTPEAISANQGDIVTFEFHQKNHSVVQSSLANPCAQTDGGFNSGYMPVAADQTSDFPVYNITVMDEKPIWVFCSQKIPVSHCGLGMVFAVNCGADGAPNSFTNFKAAALAQGGAAASSNPYGAPAAAPPTAPPPPAASPSDSSAAAPPASSDSAPPPASSPTDPNSPISASSNPTGSVIKVIVGGNGTLTYDPPRVSAAAGDTILFEFQTKNHTVTQSTFANPCQRLDNATTNQVGFDSDFMPVAAGSSDFPTFSLPVNSTSPVWVYCKQRTPVSHCGAGMVFAINSDDSSEKSYSAFVALAKQQGNATNSTGSTDASQSGAIKTVSTLSTLGLVSIVGALMVMV